MKTLLGGPFISVLLSYQYTFRYLYKICSHNSISGMKKGLAIIPSLYFSLVTQPGIEPGIQP